jgi:hypothetical protein
MAKTVRLMEVLGGTSTFDKAFPDLAEALIQYYEIGDGIEGSRGFPPPGTYTNPHQVTEPRMRCSNKRCKRGGYDIEQEIRNMTYGKVTDREFILRCEGDEGSPGGRKKGNSCMNMLHVRLKLKYKDVRVV